MTRIAIICMRDGKHVIQTHSNSATDAAMIRHVVNTCGNSLHNISRVILCTQDAEIVNEMALSTWAKTTERLTT